MGYGVRTAMVHEPVTTSPLTLTPFHTHTDANPMSMSCLYGCFRSREIIDSKIVIELFISLATYASHPFHLPLSALLRALYVTKTLYNWWECIY